MTLLEGNNFIKEIFKEFFDGDNIPIIPSDGVLHYILHMYSRMRGKDHVRNYLMAKGKTNLKLHTRQSMAAVSDSKMLKKVRREKSASEDDDEIELHQAIIVEVYSNSDDESSIES